MNDPDRLARLRRTEVLRPLAPAVREALVADCTTVSLRQGEVLFAQGDEGDSLYVVESGRLEIYSGEARLDEVSAGDSFGEMALFLNEPRSASVRALEGSRLLRLDRARFLDVLEGQPSAMVGLLRDLASKVRSSIRIRVEQHKTAERLRQAFAQSVSAEVMDQVLAQANPTDLLEGEDRRATVVFADIRSFTTRSEYLAPREALRLLNGYLGTMIDAVLEHGGTLDKFLGDGMMALFGIPLASEGYVAQAVKCAYEMTKRVTAPIGVGLVTGPVVAGCVGNERRMEYTAIGDAVNLSSRLEGLTKAYGTPLLLCGTTAAGAGDALVVRQVDRVRVKGKSVPTDLFDVLGPPSEGAWRLRERYGQAMAHYRARRYEKAGSLFSELDEREGDGPSRTMAARCGELASGGGPQVDAADGVFSFDHK
jgi:class 3 adenylate cyclase